MTVELLAEVDADQALVPVSSPLRLDGVYQIGTEKVVVRSRASEGGKVLLARGAFGTDRAPHPKHSPMTEVSFGSGGTAAYVQQGDPGPAGAGSLWVRGLFNDPPALLGDYVSIKVRDELNENWIPLLISNAQPEPDGGFFFARNEADESEVALLKSSFSAHGDEYVSLGAGPSANGTSIGLSLNNNGSVSFFGTYGAAIVWFLDADPRTSPPTGASAGDFAFVRAPTLGVFQMNGSGDWINAAVVGGGLLDVGQITGVEDSTLVVRAIGKGGWAILRGADSDEQDDHSDDDGSTGATVKVEDASATGATATVHGGNGGPDLPAGDALLVAGDTVGGAGGAGARVEAHGAPGDGDDGSLEIYAHEVSFENMFHLTGFGTLPTVDPHVLGEVWQNSGVLTMSAG